MSEQTANLCTTDACESLRARLAKYEDAEGLPVVQLSAEAYQQAANCLYVLREIGSMDADDISGDDVDLRFEDGEGRDTGCDVSIVEYAERSAVAIEALFAALESQAREIELVRDALDHIARTCTQSRTQTRRLRWINYRANTALEGKTYDEKLLDLPKNGDQQAIKAELKIKALKADLADLKTQPSIAVITGMAIALRHVIKELDAEACEDIDYAQVSGALAAGQSLSSSPVSSAPSHGEQVQDGWQLVPIKPTSEMLAATIAGSKMENRADLRPMIYRAMLAAAPSAGSQEKGE